MKQLLSLLICLSCFATLTNGQHLGFGVKGGFTLGFQKSLYPLASYHGDLFFEYQGRWVDRKETGKYSRIGFVTHLGYHRKGASYTGGRFYGNNGATISIEDVFHNISLMVGLKGSYQFGNFSPYYLTGLRADFTPHFELVLQQQQNNPPLPDVSRAMFGFSIGGGVDWEPPKVPFGLFLEISVSPDVTPQVIKYYTQTFNYSTGVYTTQILSEPEKTINVVLEISVGIKFISRKVADEVEDLN